MPSFSYLHPTGVARNFSQGVRNSNCLQSSTDALHCFCRERNFDSRTRHHLPHFLNGNLTEVAEMHHGQHTAAAAAHCWWQHALLHLVNEELGKFVGVNVS